MSKPSTRQPPWRPRSSPLPPETLPPTARCPQLHLLFSTRHLPSVLLAVVLVLEGVGGKGPPGCLAVRPGGRPGSLPVAQGPRAATLCALWPPCPRGGGGGESQALLSTSLSHSYLPCLGPKAQPLPQLRAVGGRTEDATSVWLWGECNPATEPQAESVQSAKG